MSISLGTEFLIIFLLVLANGFFSAAEIATVTLRRSQVSTLVADGRRGAQTVAEMKAEPARFLATVQIGLTVVSSMASVIGGAGAVSVLEPALAAAPVPFVREWAAPIALALTVTVISYLTLVLGELLPKSLALRHAETLACSSAPLIHALARISAPLVHILTWSTNVLLRPFGELGDIRGVFVSEEEVKHIVREGAHHGIFDEAERELIHSVFEFADTSVREVMVPRTDIHAVKRDLPPEEVLKDLVDTGFSRAPVYEGDLDHIVGIVHVKDLVRVLQKEKAATFAAILHPAFFVPDSMQISDLLRELQTRRTHMAIVLNEFGTVIGLATIEDVLEEIVGEIRDEFDIDEELPVQQLADGSLLVDGSVPLGDLKEKYNLPVEETDDYRTLAGLILARLKRIPKGGEAIVYDGLKMTVVTIDDRRLRKVRIERLPAAAAAAGE